MGQRGDARDAGPVAWPAAASRSQLRRSRAEQRRTGARRVPGRRPCRRARRSRWPRWPRAASWRASAWRSRSSPRPPRRWPTLIFDEVDAGIGGAVAETVGRLLQAARPAPPGAVRHAPAAGGRARRPALRRAARRSDDGAPGVAASSASTRKARVEELARMLGGVEITETTRKHAREMLAS
ncbi:MAG: hypothetical protein MZW92_01880 [Comamonadaceae bacterium]|nr:hypothetical protein [Comamonadaceae bacterium]